MSMIREYLKLIPTAIKNSDKIIEGIVNKVENNLGLLPEDEQKVIAHRLLICQTCPYMSENARTNPAILYKSDRADEHCIHCGCNIMLKTSSLQSNCGIEIWNRNHPDNQLLLRWEAYIKTK